MKKYKLTISKWLEWLKQPFVIPKDYISLDCETTGPNMHRDDMHFFTYDYKGEKGIVITRPDLVKKPNIPKHILKAMNDPKVVKIIHSSQFDIPFFRTKLGIHLRNIWDTAIMEMIICAGEYPETGNVYSESSLANCLIRYGFVEEFSKDERDEFIDYRGPITPKMEKYGLRDIKYLKKLADRQLKNIKEMELDNTAKLENLTCEVTAELRYNGVAFDEEFWIDLANENKKAYDKLVRKLPKQVENWNSPAQIKKFFSEYHGIEIESLEELPQVKNKDLDILKQVRALYPSVIKYGIKFLTRTHKKIKRKEPTVDDDGRIRANYMQVLETGRYSISNPPLQTMPAKGQHRYAFIASPGCSIVGGDFTGQELGVIAAGSKEPVWIDAMLKGHDVHSVMADKIYSNWKEIGEKKCKFPFKCDCPEHKKLRRPAKDLNFGLAYGKGTESFALEAGIPLKEAYKIVRKYKKSIPRVIKWLDTNGNHAVKHGWIRTLPPFNRLRIVEGEDWKKRNRGKNTPVQGSGADMMKLAMCMMFDFIYSNDLYPQVKLVLQVHDELLTECKKGFAKEWAKIMKYFMEEAAMVITKDRLVPTEPEIVERWHPKD